MKIKNILLSVILATSSLGIANASEAIGSVDTSFK